MLNRKMIITGLLLLLSVSASSSYAATEVSSPSRTCVPDRRAVVYDETAGTIIRSTNGTCVRTEWMNDSDVCATQVATPRLPPRSTIATLSREERTVYFGFNHASLSPEMKQRLDTLALKLKSDHSVKGARIIGYADRIGTPGYNEALSKKRAEAARQYLIAKGIINTRVAETRWLGASTTVTDCANNLPRPELIDCLQGDRRVEVEIDYYPEAQQTQPVTYPE